MFKEQLRFLTSLEGMSLISLVRVHTHTNTHLLCAAWNRSRQLLGWVGETAEAASLSHRTAGGVRRRVGNDRGEESSVSCQD